jgi:sugar phosphate isomerase/epimerase
MAYWFSSGAFSAHNVLEVLAEADRMGIRGVELSSGLAYSQDMLDHVREAHTTGRQRFLVHNYFPPPREAFVLNIAARDADTLTKSREMARTAIRLAFELGAPFYSVHAGFAALLKPEMLGKPEQQAAAFTIKDIDRAGAYEVMVRTVRDLADFAAPLGLGLLIENNVISPLYLEKMPVNPLLLTDAPEVVRFFVDVKRSNVGLLLDVAHVKVSATALGFRPEAFVDQVGEYVRCLHLSDNDGRVDSNQPFADEAWFMHRLKDFARCEMVVEAYRLSPELMLYQRDLIERILA